MDNDYQLEDHMALNSLLYPGGSTQIVPPVKESKPGYRRNKNKGERGAVGPRKRKLSKEQVDILEQNFGSEPKLQSERKDQLASELGLDPGQVAIWFKNRRARWKNKQVEEEYAKLRSVHEGNVNEKRRLETEVLELKEELIKSKEELIKSKEEIQRLQERADGPASCSNPSSSMSTDASMDRQCSEEFAYRAFCYALDELCPIDGMYGMSPLLTNANDGFTC